MRDPSRYLPRSNYIDPAKLAELVTAYHDTQTVSGELAEALMKLAGGVWDRFHFTADRDDFVQDIVLHLLGAPLRRSDPEKNLFAWFTTCAIRQGGKLRERAESGRRQFQTYAEELAESGRELPERREQERR